MLTAYQVRGNVVSLWRSFVTTELVSLLLMGLKNRHGHWLCWMSTGIERTVKCEEHTHWVQRAQHNTSQQSRFELTREEESSRDENAFEDKDRSGEGGGEPAI